MNSLEAYGFSEFFSLEAANYPDWHPARVLSQHKSLYTLHSAEGELLGQVTGKFRHQTAQAADFPAVGDFVLLDRSVDDFGQAQIQLLLPRKSLFDRKQAGDSGKAQVVAANMDLVFICAACGLDYNPRRLERYLSATWASGSRPIILLTKSDLAESINDLVFETEELFPGVEVMAVSSSDPHSLERMRASFAPGETAAFLGSSGIGKSTLINSLAGHELLETGAIGETGKGRHTTTRRQLLLLPDGRLVMDTPGMRELGLEQADLSDAFSRLAALEQDCRFADCRHQNEPGCAIQAAIASGELDPAQLASYRKLKQEMNYDGLSWREIEDSKIKNMFGSKSAMKTVMQEIKRKKGRG